MTDIDCPRAKTWMTPCIARDGHLALDDPWTPVCVGCGARPEALLRELRPADPLPSDPDECADQLTKAVAAYVESKA